MDIQEAISEFKMENALLGVRNPVKVARNDLAISALHEQAEREKGCEFCSQNGDRIIEAFGDGWMKIVSAAGHFAVETEDNDSTTNLFFNIRYCPKCGRRLK